MMKMDVQKDEHRTRALLLLDKLPLLLLCSTQISSMWSQTRKQIFTSGSGLVRSLLVLVLIIILPCAGPATHTHDTP